MTQEAREVTLDSLAMASAMGAKVGSMRQGSKQIGPTATCKLGRGRSGMHGQRLD